MASAWGAAFGSAWGNSWGSVGGVTPTPAPETDTHDGGWYSADEIRKRLKRVEEAQEKSARKQREAEKRLTDELDRAYRRIVLNEPEIAAEVAAAVTQSIVPLYEELPVIDWRALADVAQTARAIIEIFERDRRAALAEEDDIEVLLMAAL